MVWCKWILEWHALTVGDAKLSHELLGSSEWLALLVEMDHMLIRPQLKTSDLNFVVEIFKVFLECKVFSPIKCFDDLT